jgi:hypothetical protein
MFTKQYVIISDRAHLSTMSSGTTNKAAPGAEEQICIVDQQTRKGIKCEAVHNYGYRSREN